MDRQAFKELVAGVAAKLSKERLAAVFCWLYEPSADYSAEDLQKLVDEFVSEYEDVVQ